MAAPLSEFVEGFIYLDTMILYSFVRADEASRPILKRFFGSIEQGKITAFTSVLAFDELIHRLLLAAIRDKYSGSPLDRLREQEQEMMAEFYPRILPPLRLLRHFPHLEVLGVLPADGDAMLDIVERYSLRPRDALHLSAMQKVECKALASNDSDFDRVPGIQRFEVAFSR